MQFETAPVWLPDYAIAEARPLRVAGAAALAFALAKELSGEAEMDRARQSTVVCQCAHTAESHPAAINGTQARQETVRVYLEMAERKFKGVKRCC